jgi:ABC-type molybdate transport system substrate-binding protein
MTVGSFVSTPSSTGTLTSGVATVKVGGVLNVAANQFAASYTNTTGLTVTVNYN